MRKLILIFLGIVLADNAFGTAQIPDKLIYQGDTIRLYSNPLESLYNNDNPRPENFFKLEGCWNTACWRGYQATWEIKENKLYLIEIADCCHGDEYYIDDNVIDYLGDKLQPEVLEKIKDLKGIHLNWHFQHKLEKELGGEEYENNIATILKASLRPRQKADLVKLFGEHCEDGRVFAFWFTGNLTVPKGKLVEYVHMGYGSIYEKTLVLSIENGILIDDVEYENRNDKIKNGFGVFQAISYSIILPAYFISKEENCREYKNISYLYSITDTMKFFNKNRTSSIEASANFNDEKTTSATRKILVEKIVDSLSENLSVNYDFSPKRTEKLRWGTASWIDGFSNDKNERIRIFAMSNINSKVIIYYKEKGVSEEKFTEKADYITHSVRLLEFGY